MEKKGDPGKRYPQSLKDEVVAVYIESAASLRELSEKYGVANPTIWRWISNFAKENQEDTRLMDKI